MGDIFMSEDVKRLLHNKLIVIVGDSIQRGVYKDLIVLLQQNKYITQNALRSKGENSFMNDALIEHTKQTNGKEHREVRQYHTGYHLVRYYYVTRCYSEYMETVLDDLEKEPPDIIIMNSCVWDITRYGASGMGAYRENLQQIFGRFSQILKGKDTLVLWTTALPLGSKIQGGFWSLDIQFLCETLRYDVIEANYYASEVAKDHSYDVLDLHYYFRTFQHMRVKDGIHWNYLAHRRMTNLLLSHICETWAIPLPRQWLKNRLLAHNEERYGSAEQQQQQQQPQQQRQFNGRPNYLHDRGWEQPEFDFGEPDPYQERYGGPIRRPNYMGPPQHHMRTQSCDQQYLMGNFANGRQVSIVPNQSLAQMNYMNQFNASMVSQAVAFTMPAVPQVPRGPWQNFNSNYKPRMNHNRAHRNFRPY